MPCRNPGSMSHADASCVENSRRAGGCARSGRTGAHRRGRLRVPEGQEKSGVRATGHKAPSLTRKWSGSLGLPWLTGRSEL
jgi:hypothetical protein